MNSETKIRLFLLLGSSLVTIMERFTLNAMEGQLTTPLGNERGLAVLYQTSTRGGCFSRAAYALQIPSNLN